MRLPLLVSCLIIASPIGGCDTDPSNAAGAAGSLKVAPAKQRTRTEVQSSKVQDEEDELQMRTPPTKGSPTVAKPTATKLDGTLKIDGIDGESKDNEHRVLSSDAPAGAAGSVKIDGIDGESQDKKH